jgi:hypothetical protein
VVKSRSLEGREAGGALVSAELYRHFMRPQVAQRLLRRS